VGKVVQPLQSVNYHDNRTHGHEQHGSFTPLVEFGWVGSVGFESSYFGLWYAAGVKRISIVLGLAIGGLPMSSVGLITGGRPVNVG
jgi:hypothetical protein